VDIEKLILSQVSLFGSSCFFCEKPVQKGEKVLAVEKRIGVGIVSKSIRYETHIPCASAARDILSRKISEAGGS
jgi:hypothetical protein